MINAGKLHYDLHFLFQDFVIDEEMVQTQGMGQTQHQKIPRALFEFEREFAQAVYQTTFADLIGVGTSFLMGKNVVMTNRHILEVQNNAGKMEVDGCGFFCRDC